MKIVDINDVEISEEDVDLEKGYLKPESKIIAHHDAVPAQEREFHYSVRAFYFEDGSNYIVKDENDPHIIKEDINKGVFGWQELEGETPRNIRGIDLNEVETSPRKEAQEAWDEYEDFYRYILYTEEEIAEREAATEAARKQEEFINGGAARLETIEAQMSTAESQISESANKISAAEGKIAIAEEKIAFAEEKIATSEDNISAIGTNLTTAEDKLANAENKIAKAEEDIVSTSEVLSETSDTVEELILTVADILAGEDALLEE